MTVVDLFSRTERKPQEEAADPTLSVFVTANAGSGKTKTLIDRVARLLLAKARPETILCVTYTKAAASEMQRRLYDTLGGWSVAADATLRAELGNLRSRDPKSFDGQEISEARSLFAAALETPGGLKIQTIHAFCEKVLKRFPLEAGVPPGFRVMDEPAAAAVAAAARRDVAHRVLSVPGPLADAYARLSVSLDFRRFQAMFAEFENRRGALNAFFDAQGGLEGALDWVWRTVDAERDEGPDDLARKAMARLDRASYRACAELLRRSANKTDAERAAVLQALADAAYPSFDEAVGLFFTKAGEPQKWVENAKQVKAEPTLQTFLLAEQSRLEVVRKRMRAAQVGRDSSDALALAYAYLAAYHIEKDAAGGLDFADLVERTCALLSDGPAAAWVLYKLDGGLEHILLDEAQDTAPEQWSIIDALTDDFFSGLGRREAQRLQRGVFVVGDRKQSIYSFQGARPELLAEKFDLYRDRAKGVGHTVRRLDLTESWRSAPQVLEFVDAVFAPAPLTEAVQAGDPVVHAAAEPLLSRTGCVDLWDLDVDRKGQERGAWDLPLDLEPEDSANRRLARRIADEIDALIARGDAVHAKDGTLRPATAGDVLILVRRRGVLFEEILRALKHKGLPVAGADRLSLSTHIIFDDLLALARFALFPGDDLTLAALLKSPFCGLDDDSLYALAHGREGRLWRALRDRAAERPDWAEAGAFLRLAIETARSARPFEFWVRLTEHVGPDGRSMRRRLLHRLGAEARDALDEFLNQVLAAEGRGAHDLESVAEELHGLDIVVKREMDGGRNEIRVMTAHGAKGLEAPIVILPETNLAQTQRGSPLLRIETGDGEVPGFLWCPRSAGDCPATSEARKLRAAREEAEAYRLLYVALTRARDRLILCGRRAERTDPDKLRGWWGAVRDAIDLMGLEKVREVQDASGGRVRRYGPDPQRARGGGRVAAPTPMPPAWAGAAAAPEAFARYASPSDLGEGYVAAAPSPLAQAEGLGRFRRGDLIHRLLQLLPDLPAADRAAGAAAILGREADLTDAQRAEMTAAALSVLEDGRFAEVFGPGSRAEVAIAGTGSALPPGLNISGRIDRLVVLPERVLVIDFKTNRPSPERIEDADPAYLRQMALYAAVLGDIFPGRRVEPAIVWTDGPKLMPVPENLWSSTLADLRRGG